MSTQQPNRDNQSQPGRSENQTPGNGAGRNTSVPNEKDESISTAGDYAFGKGSKTEVRKDEKESNDNYDHGRQA